jgi:CDP-paratose 2-epimerase
MAILITGGAGFLGSNLAHYYADQGETVLVLDNMSRTSRNLPDLQAKKNIKILHEDLVTANLHDLVANVTFVIHAAAQAAVTHSLTDPDRDFMWNAYGTFRLLEALRALPEENRPPVVYFSTNKVYGHLSGVRTRRWGKRHVPIDRTVERGLDEATPIDLASPYGCSKGTGDLYMIDYARSFNVPTTVLRCSCMYGGRQHADEHQGWVSHFMLAAARGDKVTIYGDGAQVRDLLHVDDVIAAVEAVRRNPEVVRGEVYNLGGGPENTISILELLNWLDTYATSPEVGWGPTRIGDQRWYATDTWKFERAVGWTPQVDLATGLERLWQWAKNNS